MATLPPSADITGGAITEGQAKTWLTNVRTFIASLLGSDGTQPAALAALGAPWHGSIVKTGAYTVVAADRGKVLKCDGTWTLSFTAAATLGDGFYVEVINDSSGVITLDANSSELIDGVTTLALAAGKSVVAYCDGEKFMTFGRGGVESFNTRTGAVTLASGDISAALGYAPAGRVAGHTLGTAVFVTGSINLYANFGPGPVVIYEYHDEFTQWVWGGLVVSPGLTVYSPSTNIGAYIYPLVRT